MKTSIWVLITVYLGVIGMFSFGGIIYHIFGEPMALIVTMTFGGAFLLGFSLAIKVMLSIVENKAK